ncbi:uncharacterized protein BJ171DRAFT_498450 [Polychytrium aggregatum]|uniref:uncharacterized protein n=1 Tax=Polychytrium aggregatum TaxID=110093 RepID=UPI0022FE03ED|nr:uncharacterized protein BJ171DRAFT_498450 [Polychytrium aggregatum]KAI9206034.1 hypothetical protein BJ171DRAFT_498450 [Polychytrium aggregatum]
MPHDASISKPEIERQLLNELACSSCPVTPLPPAVGRDAASEIPVATESALAKLGAGRGKPKKSCAKCRSSPDSFRGLGIEEWIDLDAQAMARESLGADPRSMQRQGGEPVGLKNLGATCYINSLLQIWFHDLKFRSLIYGYRPLYDSGETDIITELQKVFARLDHGMRKWANPSAFIESIGVDPSVQQDAPEFCKLFISLASQQLKSHMVDFDGNTISDRFQSTYAYVTTCSKCGFESRNESPQFELQLNIKDRGNLHEFIESYQKPETLADKNQYFCPQCYEKRDALRHTQLTQLPTVLNIQLLRFMFDEKTMSKVKVHSTIWFPLTLNMSRLLLKHEPAVYDLQAVLLHQGSDAYGGHYTASVYDARNESWFHLDDTVVKRIDPMAFTNWDNFKSSTKTNPNPPDDGKSFCSEKVYMLSYKLRSDAGLSDVALPFDLPSSILSEIEADDVPLISQIDQYQKEEDRLVASIRALRDAKLSIIGEMPSREEDSPSVYIPTLELERWMELPEIVGGELVSGTNTVLNCTSLLCAHGHFDPSQIKCSKRISQLAAACIETSGYQIKPLLCTSDICGVCWSEKCEEIRWHESFQEMRSSVTKALLESDPKTMWISKRWLQDMKKRKPNGPIHPMGRLGGPLSDSYLRDVFCEHNGLAINPSDRTLVSLKVLDIIRSFFPETDAHAKSEDECILCQEQLFQQNEEEARLENRARLQKGPLRGLLGRQERLPEAHSDYRIVSDAFVQALKRFDQMNIPPDMSASSISIFCDHGGLLYDLGHPRDRMSVRYVTEEEWTFLQTEYPSLAAAQVTTDSNGSPIDVYPPPCHACRLKRHLQYSSGYVKVRVARADAVKTNVDADADDRDEDGDDEIKTMGRRPNTKRQKLDSVYRGARPTPSNPTATWQSAGPRRATRLQSMTSRGFKPVPIHPGMTVRDLMAEIYRIFHIAPCDQRLHFGTHRISYTSATRLTIPPPLVLPGCELAEDESKPTPKLGATEMPIDVDAPPMPSSPPFAIRIVYTDRHLAMMRRCWNADSIDLERLLHPWNDDDDDDDDDSDDSDDVGDGGGGGVMQPIESDKVLIDDFGIGPDDEIDLEVLEAAASEVIDLSGETDREGFGGSRLLGRGEGW